MAEMRIDLLRDQLAMSQAHISPLASTVAALVAERDRLVGINADLLAACKRAVQILKLMNANVDEQEPILLAIAKASERNE